jgi:hypothetical protein
MSRATRLLGGLVLFALPLAAHGQQPQQPQRRGNPSITQVPAPGGRLRGLDERAPQPTPAPSIEITFDRNPVRVGEDSVVTLKPENVVLESPFVFTVVFGDGTRTDVERGKAAVVHGYRAATSYTVSVSVSPVPGSEIASFTPMPVVSNNDTSISVVDIELGVSPNTSTTGEPVSFNTQFQSSDPNIRYRFTFGDGTSSDWLTTPEAQHVFGGPGNYPNTYVEVGRSSAGLPGGDVPIVARSASVPVQVNAAQLPGPPPGPEPGPTPVPSPVPPEETSDWLAYAVAILAVLAVLGYSAKHWLSSPRPTLEAHRDPSALSQVVDGRAFAIDIEIRLHRAVAASGISSGPGEARLVTAIMRTRG